LINILFVFNNLNIYNIFIKIKENRSFYFPTSSIVMKTHIIKNLKKDDQQDINIEGLVSQYYRHY
jgi:hypothetical protein